jgi:hypothetical protein
LHSPERVNASGVNDSRRRPVKIATGSKGPFPVTQQSGPPVEIPWEMILAEENPKVIRAYLVGSSVVVRLGSLYELPGGFAKRL